MKALNTILLFFLSFILLISSGYAQPRHSPLFFDSNSPFTPPNNQGPIRIIKNIKTNIFDRLSKSLNSDSSIVIDSIITVNADGTSELHIYRYNSYGYQTLKLDKLWDNNCWENKEQTISTYTGDFVTLHQVWENGNWKNNWRQTASQNNDGSSLSILFEVYNNGSWVNTQLLIATWTSNVSTEIVKIWGNGEWVNESRTTRTANSEGNTLENIEEEWTNDSWIKKYRRSVEYDSDGNKILDLFQMWKTDINDWYPISRDILSDFAGYECPQLILGENYKEGTWVKACRIRIRYDAAGNKISSTTERWDGENYLYSRRDTFSYDIYGNITSFLKQGYNSESGEWTNSIKFQYNYDGNGLMTSGFYYRWENNNWIPYDGNLYTSLYISNMLLYYRFNTAEIYAFYGKILTDIEKPDIISKDFSLDQNYPNPFNPATTIKYEIPKTTFVTLKVYNLLGKEVAVLVNKKCKAGRHEETFTAKNLSSGIYIYTIQAGEFISSKKMILLK